MGTTSVTTSEVPRVTGMTGVETERKVKASGKCSMSGGEKVIGVAGKGVRSEVSVQAGAA